MRPNILFIIIDALRARNVGCYGYKKAITPNIDRIANDSIVFNNAFSTINTTDPSLTSILTGQYPSSHGIIAHGNKVKDYQIKNLINLRSQFLQEILNNYDYNTIAVDFLERWHKFGFDEYLSELKKKSRSKKLLRKIFDKVPSFLQRILRKISIKLNIISGYSSKDYKFLKYKREREFTDITIQKINELANKKSPFFIFLHYWGVHIPYEPPPQYLEDLDITGYQENPPITQIIKELDGQWKNRLERFIDLYNVKSTQEMLARYDICIKFVDDEVGRIISTLQEQNIYNDTIILITSDHGESLTEHGIYFDHHGLYDVSIHVPIIMKFPNFKYKKINSLVQHIDILPTVLDYLNIPYSENIDGKSMIPLINNGNRFRELILTEEHHTEIKKSIRTKNFKYIYSDSKKNATCEYCGKIHGGIEELYDLRSDPNENTNLINDKTKIAEEFKKLLEIKYNQILERSKISNVVRNIELDEFKNI